MFFFFRLNSYRDLINYLNVCQEKVQTCKKIFIFRFEAKRLEIEAWLTRMENRSERMGVVASTADVLEAQQKEQKVNIFLQKILSLLSAA